MRPASSPSPRQSRPALGATSPAMMRRSVLLPQPEGPRRLRKAPLSTARSIPASASVPVRKVLATPSSAMIGAVPALVIAARGLFRRHADALVDEAQGVGLGDIEIAGIEPLRRHHLVEVAPARIAHRTDAVLQRIAAVDDAVLLDARDRIGQERVGHLGIVLLDERVARRGIAVQIAVPAFDAGIDEALHQIGLLLDHLLRGLDDRAVARIAGIGNQEDERLHALLLDREGLAGEIALLDGVFIGEEGAGIEGVWPYLVVGIAELRLQEEPPAD